jgi:hypothetical protein
VSPLAFPLESRLAFWPAAADAKLDGMCEGMFDGIQVVGPERSGCPGGIGTVSRRTGNARIASKTLRERILMYRVSKGVHRMNAYPRDCVKLGHVRRS